MNKIQIEVVYRPVADLNPAEYNPRKHTKAQKEQLMESLKRFGVVDPIIANNAKGRENIVIGGNFRLLVAREMGIKEVPVAYVHIPDVEQEKELNIRLNKNTGEFDIEKLKAFNFDTLLKIGFGEKELTGVWDRSLSTEPFDVDNACEEIKDPITKPGDIIQLGNHRLICGDCTSNETLTRLLGDERATMIISDPIYNIAIDYNGGIGGKQSYGGTVNDSKPDDEYRSFLKKSMQAALAVTHQDAHVFYWSDQVYIWMIQTLYAELGITNKRVCLWLKNAQNPTPGVAFNKCYEPCTYGVRGKPAITKNVNSLNEVMNLDLTTGNNLLSQADYVDVWPEKRLPGKKYEHSTMKPPEVYEKAIRRCTKPGDIIIDSFSGSGSTIMAGEKLGRRVYAVEIEPVFCDLAMRRYEELTGKKATIMTRNEEAPKGKPVSGTDRNNT